MIGTIKALPMVPILVVDPEITIGEQKLKFKVKMESGMYLEFNSADDCKLFGRKGEYLQDVQIEGKIPLLKDGENDIAFKCSGTKGVSSRVQVTMITEGEPIN